jgi:hypothetical protein
MIRALQVKWFDKDTWHFVRELTKGEDEKLVLKNVRENNKRSKMKCNWTYEPKFKIGDAQ